MQSKMRTLAACIRGKPYLLVMEYMELGDLCDWSKRNKEHINQNTILQLLSDVTEGISALHRARILHRDIKPSNILLHHDGTTVRAKIIRYSPS